jgi:hypothetical protein
VAEFQERHGGPDETGVFNSLFRKLEAQTDRVLKKKSAVWVRVEELEIRSAGSPDRQIGEELAERGLRFLNPFRGGSATLSVVPAPAWPG